jgi:hypothetical protein
VLRNFLQGLYQLPGYLTPIRALRECELIIDKGRCQKNKKINMYMHNWSSP